MAETQDNQSAALGGKLRSLQIYLTNYVGDQVLDLRPFISDITIYENIFSPTLHGVATMIDSIGFLSGYVFNILGEESVKIIYETSDPNSQEKILNFYLYKVDKIFNGENFKHKRYLIHFCSLEHIGDATTHVQKAYSKPNSEIVKNILTEYLATSKPINVQATKGVQDVIIPRLRPLDAIEFIRKRSIAESLYTSASYLFFETTVGFNFCDVEYLIYTGKNKIRKNPERYRYYLSQGDLQRVSLEDSNADVEDPRNYNVAESKTLFGFRQVHKFDIIERLKMGMYRSQPAVFDPVKVSFSVGSYTYDSDKHTLLEPYSENTGAFNTDFALNYKGPDRMYFVPKDSSKKDTFLEEVLPAAYMTRFSQQQFMASMIGDSNILVGDIIEIPNLTAFRTFDGKGTLDEILNGHFLIAGIVHKFGIESYTCDVELYRNGYSSDPAKPISIEA